MCADSPHKRWVRTPYRDIDGKQQKPLICSKCSQDLFSVYEQKPLRRAGTTKRVGIYAKCANPECGKVTRISAGYPR